MIYLLATPLLMMSSIPQMVHLIRTKQSADISRLTYCLTTTAILLLLIRAVEVRDTPLILANGTSFLMTLTNTLLIIKYHDSNSRMRITKAPR